MPIFGCLELFLDFLTKFGFYFNFGENDIGPTASTSHPGGHRCSVILCPEILKKYSKGDLWEFFKVQKHDKTIRLSPLPLLSFPTFQLFWKKYSKLLIFFTFSPMLVLGDGKKNYYKIFTIDFVVFPKKWPFLANFHQKFKSGENE